MADQTPVSKAVTKRACVLVRVFLSTTNGFPDDDEIEAQMKACYKNSKKHLIDAGILESQANAKPLNAHSRKIVS